MCYATFKYVIVDLYSSLLLTELLHLRKFLIKVQKQKLNKPKEIPKIKEKQEKKKKEKKMFSEHFFELFFSPKLLCKCLSYVIKSIHSSVNFDSAAELAQFQGPLYIKDETLKDETCLLLL